MIKKISFLFDICAILSLWTKLILKRSFALAMVIIEDHEKAFLFYSDIFMFFLSFENYINKAINKIFSLNFIYEFWQCLKIRVNELYLHVLAKLWEF